MSYLIGIDGGGTGARLAVADLSGREITRASGPPGLVDPRDPEAAVERLAPALRQVVAAANLKLGEGYLCAGLAGVRRTIEQEQIQAAFLSRGLAARALVRSDGEVGLQGVLGNSAGILLIAGTGSAAWGRAEDGRVASCGGWGAVMGDEGSGYAVGRAALRASARSADGRGPPTTLLPALLEEMEIDDADDLRRWANTAEKARVAALARLTVRLADQGDAVASRILADAAMALAAHARALCEQLGPWTMPVPVVLHGGLTRARTYALDVEAALQTIASPLHVRPAEAEPVTGALQLARAKLAVCARDSGTN